jgi:RNA polymerase sigma-70 factor, ECF subfamily
MQTDTGGIQAAFQAGRSAWPEASLDYERFARRMRDLAVGADELAAHGADLYLASACAENDPGALRRFEQAFVSQVEVFVARTGVARELHDEVRQRVRVKLLVGTSPSIARYRGQGPLTAWVRVTAVHAALDVGAAAGAGPAAANAQAEEQMADTFISLESSPEVQAARSLYRGRFRAAVEESLAALDSRDKALMRLQFIDGLNIDAIGAIYKVHRATVARWLVAVRTRVFEDLRKRLAMELGGSPSEMRSLVQLLREDIQLSAGRILQSKSR